MLKILPGRKKQERTEQEQQTDLTTPRGRLRVAMGQFIEAMQKGQAPQGMAGIMPLALPFLQKICMSLTDADILSTIREVRKQLDWIQLGDFSEPYSPYPPEAMNGNLSGVEAAECDT